MSTKKIPFFQNQRESIFLKKSLTNVYKKILNNGLYLQSKEVEILEKKISILLKKKYAIAVGSATDALYFSLLCSNIKKGDEVLVPSFSFIASASSIARTGAKAIFVDIGPDYNIDLNDAEKKINKRTRAIIAVNLFGKIINSKKLNRFINKNRLILIEDAAQSFGANIKNNFSNKKARFTCLSFDPTKVLSALGSGGMVACNNINDYRRIQAYRYHGKINGKFSILGFNSQMPSITAGALLVKFKYWKKWQVKRISIAKKYNSTLRKYLKVPKVYKNEHIFHKYVLFWKKRDDLAEYLEKKNISTRIHYAQPICCYNTFGKRSCNTNNCKKTKAFVASKNVLSLPIHPFLTNKEVSYICKNLKIYFKRFFKY